MPMLLLGDARGVAASLPVFHPGPVLVDARPPGGMSTQPLGVTPGQRNQDHFVINHYTPSLVTRGRYHERMCRVCDKITR